MLVAPLVNRVNFFKKKSIIILEHRTQEEHPEAPSLFDEKIQNLTRKLDFIKTRLSKILCL